MYIKLQNRKRKEKNYTKSEKTNNALKIEKKIHFPTHKNHFISFTIPKHRLQQTRTRAR
jgi:hypothetical protein